MTSFSLRIVSAVLQWRSALTSSARAAVVIAIFAAALAVDLAQLDAVYVEAPARTEAPAPAEPSQTIDVELVLIAVGDALSPFTQ